MDHAVDLSAVFLSDQVRKRRVRSHRESHDQVYKDSYERHAAPDRRQRLVPGEPPDDRHIRGIK